MNKQIIIADAGPLIAFGRVDLLSILVSTLGHIIIPQSVAQECTSDKSRPGANAIHKYIQDKIITIYEDPINDQINSLRTILGMGESAAIALAVELSEGLLVDDKLARNAATALNLKIIGTAGVLLLAKQKKIIPVVLPFIQKLRNVNYYLSNALVNEIAKIAKET